MEFCTLGMFIIDDIYPSPSAPDQTPQKDVIGGAGTYSAMGARLMSPPPLSQKVGWIVDCGTDFPASARSTIESWQTNAVLRERNGLTTRGWNGYGANEHRAFKYLTPKLRLTADDLTPELLISKSFHLICSPARCAEMVEDIVKRRQSLDPALQRPLIIWEPVPDVCIPSELNNTRDALGVVDVLSPNHAELAALLGESMAKGSESIDHGTVEEQVGRLLSDLPHHSRNGNLCVVIRCGKDGCYVRLTDRSIARWLPACHESNPEKVVDPTGGGNGFLGGFAVGLVRTGDPTKAAVYGSVSASLCIEQVGMPLLEAEGQHETWNGVNVQQRFKDFARRCSLE